MTCDRIGKNKTIGHHPRTAPTRKERNEYIEPEPNHQGWRSPPRVIYHSHKGLAAPTLPDFTARPLGSTLAPGVTARPVGSTRAPDFTARPVGITDAPTSLRGPVGLSAELRISSSPHILPRLADRSTPRSRHRSRRTARRDSPPLRSR